MRLLYRNCHLPLRLDARTIILLMYRKFLYLMPFTIYSRLRRFMVKCCLLWMDRFIFWTRIDLISLDERYQGAGIRLTAAMIINVIIEIKLNTILCHCTTCFPCLSILLTWIIIFNIFLILYTIIHLPIWYCLFQPGILLFNLFQLQL